MSKVAVGYYPNGTVAPLYDLGWEAPAGQMYSSITDLNKVCDASFQEHFYTLVALFYSWRSFCIRHTLSPTLSQTALTMS